jgi:hypothetical protein
MTERRAISFTAAPSAGDSAPIRAFTSSGHGRYPRGPKRRAGCQPRADAGRSFNGATATWSSFVMDNNQTQRERNAVDIRP